VPPGISPAKKEKKQGYHLPKKKKFTPCRQGYHLPKKRPELSKKTYVSKETYVSNVESFLFTLCRKG
jgi:hypothetical protein